MKSVWAIEEETMPESICQEEVVNMGLLEGENAHHSQKATLPGRQKHSKSRPRASGWHLRVAEGWFDLEDSCLY